MSLTGRDNRPEPWALETLEFLAEQGCGNPECTHDHKDGIVYLRQVCHPEAALDLSYTKGTGVLVIECHECKKFVGEVTVALIPTRY